MVVLIEKTSTLKIAILATLTLLTITSASALNWEAPDSPVTGDVTLNVSITEGNSDSVTFWYEDNGGWNEIGDGTLDGDYVVYSNWDTGQPGEGTTTVRANSSDDEVDREFTIDRSGPSIDVPIEDNSRVNEDAVDTDVSANDDLTDVTNLDVVVTDSEGDEIFSESDNCGDSECSVSVDLTSDLEHGDEYTMEIDTEDQVGNDNSENIDFTYDNEYEGDESPEVIPGPKVFATPEGKDEYDFEVVLDEADEPSDITVECRLEDRDEVEAGTESVDDTESYECSLEPMRDNQAQMEVIMSDEAGNSVSEEFEYTFDYTKPQIYDLSTTVSVFNSNFEVEYEASDAASGVNGLIYQVDDSDLDTGGEVLESDGSFMVDTSELDSGSHTLYVWVRDEAGRWSESDALTFDYRPDATPEASVSGLGEVRVTAGESRDFSFNVVNTGELMVPSLTFELDTGFSNQSQDTDDLMPDENRSVSFTVDTDESNLGTHEVSLNSENPDISESFQLVVEANTDQQENISDRYQSRFEEFEELKSNVTELMDKLSRDRKKKLGADFSELNETMNQAQTAVDEGRYYEADSLLEGIGSRFSEARSGYEEVREDHQVAQRNRFIFGFLLFAVVIGGGAVGYFYRHDDYEFDFSAVEDLEFGEVGLRDYRLSMEPVENLIDRVKDFLAEEEEKAEDAFQGFTN